MVSLLRKGLGLRDDQIQIGTGDMAWTLGAALYEGGALKAAAKPVILVRFETLNFRRLRVLFSLGALRTVTFTGPAALRSCCVEPGPICGYRQGLRTLQYLAK